jgi:hypothetical protein
MVKDKYLRFEIKSLRVGENKKGVRINIQPRFKIQYPMKNQYNFIK